MNLKEYLLKLKKDSQEKEVKRRIRKVSSILGESPEILEAVGRQYGLNIEEVVVKSMNKKK